MGRGKISSTVAVVVVVVVVEMAIVIVDVDNHDNDDIQQRILFSKQRPTLVIVVHYFSVIFDYF